MRQCRPTMFVFTFMLVWSFASGNQQHLVCKTIQDVFTDDGGPQSPNHVRRLQGPPGKTGPPGSPGIEGLPGPSGLPAIVDYDRLNQAVTEKVASAVAEINSRIAELERNFTEFRGAICEGNQGFYDHNKCYTIPHLTSSKDMSYSDAVAECAKTGALLAEIHNRNQQKALRNFVFSKLPSGLSAVDVWIGMEHQTETSTLLYRSGKRAASALFQWDSSYPHTQITKKLVGLEVRNDSGSAGLWNESSTSTNGVLCEK